MNYISEYGFTLEKSEDDAGFDIRTPHPIYLPPRFETKIHTGLRIDASSLDEPHFILAVPRSSAGCKKNIKLKNTVGIIDPSYRGDDDEIVIWIKRYENSRGQVIGFKEGDPGQIPTEFITNSGETVEVDRLKHSWHYSKGVWFITTTVMPPDNLLYGVGDRFAQLLFIPFSSPQAKMVDTLEQESRGGFGSTGDN